MPANHINSNFLIAFGQDAIVGAAIHDGHAMRDGLRDLSGLTDDERLREEDPFTGLWAAICDSRIVGKCSRFEVDLNRPRDKAVYQQPTDAWGLNIWKSPLSETEISQSLAIYDQFFRAVRTLLTKMLKTHERIVVLDLHSYNHRRNGENAAEAKPLDNPEVNIGTGTFDRDAWGPWLDRFMADLRDFDFDGRHLDVRENVKFRGGEFGKWIHQSFPGRVCAPAIEFKKFFMDEWTGRPDVRMLGWIGDAIKSTLPGIREELEQMESDSSNDTVRGSRRRGSTTL